MATVNIVICLTDIFSRAREILSKKQHTVNRDTENEYIACELAPGDLDAVCDTG